MIRSFALLLLTAAGLQAAAPITDIKMTGSGSQVASGTLSIKSGASLVSDAGSTVNLSLGTLTFGNNRIPWAAIDKTGAVFGGDAGSGGTVGLVPAPGAGDAAAGKVLGAGGTWVDASGGSSALVDLTDVALDSPTNGDVLTYDGSEWVNAALPGGFVDPTTTKGDLMVRGASAVERLGIGTDGQVLVADSAAGAGVKWDTPSSGAAALDDLTDVEVTTPASGEVLTYDGSEWVNAPATGGASALDDLEDVAITSPINQQALVYDALGGTWVNQSMPGGGALASLADVVISSPQNNQTLVYDAGLDQWRNDSSAGGALTDPTTTKGDLIVRGASTVERLGIGTDGQVLVADSTAGTGVKWDTPSSGAAALGDLTDVEVATPADGEVLTYDDGQWVNAPASGGGTALTGVLRRTTSQQIVGQDEVNNIAWSNYSGSPGMNDALEGFIAPTAGTYLVTANFGIEKSAHSSPSYVRARISRHWGESSFSVLATERQDYPASTLRYAAFSMSAVALLDAGDKIKVSVMMNGNFAGNGIVTYGSTPQATMTYLGPLP